ncbi:MAG: ABC transporter permease [Kofleriaceae bacterium]
MVPIQYNVRSLFVRKVTTFATAFGIALVVFVAAGSLMLGEGVSRAVETGSRDDTAIILRKGSDAELSSTLSNDILGLFRGHPQVSQAAGGGVIGEIVVIITADRVDGSGISNVLVRGTPPEGFAFRPEIKITKGRAPKPGTNEVVVGEQIAGRFKGVAMGGQFELRRNRPLLVVGEFTTTGTNGSEVIGDLDVIRRAVGRESIVSSARVRLTDKNAFDAYRAVIEADKRFSAKVMRESDYFKKVAGQTSGFLLMLGGGIAFMFSIAAMLGAAITMNGAVAHRTREIGTLRALGFSRFAILFAFLLEAMLLAALGGGIGTLCAFLLSFLSFPIMNFQTFSEIVIGFPITGGLIIQTLIFSVGMGLIGGLAPAIRASRIAPVEAMRG